MTADHEPTARIYDWRDFMAGKHRRDRVEPITPLGPTAHPGQAHAYAEKALADEVATVASAAEGTRNDTLNRAAFSLAQLVAAGHLDGDRVHDELGRAARAAGLDPREIGATLRSGHRAGTQHPRQVTLTTGGDAPATEVDAADIAPRAATNGHRPPDTPGAAADADDGPDTAERERTSWWPEPLGVRAAEAQEAPEPALLSRVDGQCLAYAGKVNGLIGESESGKSWVLLLAVAQTLQAGLRVLLLDFEDAPAAILNRLELMGVTAEQLALLDYADPDQALGVAESADLNEALAHPYTLIGVDGVNAAMTLLGYDLNSNTDATLFNRRLLKRLAATGAGVLTVDHVPKNTEQRGKGGIGAQAKRAMMDGSCLRVEVATAFGKGRSGVLKLTVDKDRPGHVRGASLHARTAGKVRLVSDGESVQMSITAPDEHDDATADTFRPTTLMERVSDYLKLAGDSGVNGIKAGVSGKNTQIANALDVLVAESYVAIHRDGQTRIHTLAQPYRAHLDPASDTYSGGADSR